MPIILPIGNLEAQKLGPAWATLQHFVFKKKKKAQYLDGVGQKIMSSRPTWAT